ncbi:helix-turn-helix domain-containing protein [Treponema pectinovorum]|uniref:helix-turn-helix domain-containing protein n=1 Tax=Treponema pectinovorum TaxID=164 RepID=UPI0011CC2B57|nr:helix-turn-helix domain-containing protein [Treponema pectinovorum]
MAQKEGKNMQNSIIQENYIDEEAAKQYLNDCYKDVDLLPNVPEKLTVQTMAAVLNISEPTVSRMITAQEINPFKKDVLNYILKNMLVNHPIIDTPEDKKEPEKFATKQQRKSKTAQLELLF